VNLLFLFAPRNLKGIWNNADSVSNSTDEITNGSADISQRKQEQTSSVKVLESGPSTRYKDTQNCIGQHLKCR